MKLYIIIHAKIINMISFCSPFFRLILFFLFLGTPHISYSQSDPSGNSPITSTFAITNATIVPSPGKKIENGTLIISDGLISDVGINVSIPSHAEIIDGNGLYVYAGFIDGMSHTGVKKPEPIERPRKIFTPAPPNDYAGITPEIQALNQLDVEQGRIKSLRKIGFGISHTVPHGRMLPGKGALIVLKDAEHPDELILSNDFSLYSQFVGAPGAYPGNTLGIMAKWRNIYKNAELSHKHSKLYASSAKGIVRPSQDRVLQAFFPVVEQSQSVFYNTTTLLEAQRAMRLQDEMGFKLVLGNVEEAWPLKDTISDKVSLFLSLNIPAEPNMANDEDSEEIQNLISKRKEFYNRQMEQFNHFYSTGIKFGFTTMNMSVSKIKPNLIKLQDFGFDSTKALATLTTHAAEILGISEIAGTLEPGKIGNAVITTGPYFNERSNVKIVFVDGLKYTYETKKKSPKNNDSPTNKMILGSWNYIGSSPQREISGTFIFSNETGELSGTITSAQGMFSDGMLNDLSLENNTLTFNYSIELGGQRLEFMFTGELSENTINGDFSIPAFNTSFPVTATKEEQPEERK